MQVEPIAGALGAEISGVDLSSELVQQRRRRHVRDARSWTTRLSSSGTRRCTPNDQVRFAGLFGEPDIYPFIEGLPDTPEVIEIRKELKADAKNFGGSWHSDTSYMAQPALGTVLYALETPNAGGDTLVCQRRLPPMKRCLTA